MGKRTSGRVERPKNPKSILDLSAAVYQKHLNDGPNSPLYHLAGINWDEIGQKVMAGLAHHQQAEELKRKMEENYRDRDNIVAEVEQATNATKALLKAMFSQNPKKLGDWGYNVDDSIPAKKKTS